MDFPRSQIIFATFIVARKKDRARPRGDVRRAPQARTFIRGKKFATNALGDRARRRIGQK
jgi:hypothetical protein